MTPLAILGTGLVTAVGSDAPSTLAACRARLAAPSPTRFADAAGDWIMAHQADLGASLPPSGRAIERLARMAATAADEAVSGLASGQRDGLVVLLCVAEADRPGRVEHLDDALLDRIEMLLRTRFDAARSSILRQGRVGVAVALSKARGLLAAGAGRVLIVAADSLLDVHTLMAYDRADRLLRQDNSNGFMPGEGAGALLVGPPSGQPELLVLGLGFAREPATIDSDLPLRADGLAAAIRVALDEAGMPMHELDFRITDLSGEQYYFKEAALALQRTLHRPKAEFDLWHPAECIGETGALVGAAIVAWAETACRKGYDKGSRILAHLSNDGGERAAVVLRFGTA